MKFTSYFHETRKRGDRATIELAWIERTIAQPFREVIQQDGRIRIWSAVPEAGGRYLRVILLADRVTVHNAFFDRDFQP